MVSAPSGKKIYIRNIQTIIMKQKKGFVLREVCGENAIVGEGLDAIDFGRLLSLNETAAWLWNEAQSQVDFTVDSLTDKLCEEYDVAPDTARRDIENIVKEWQKIGVIED